jgi:hypothetical protein
LVVVTPLACVALIVAKPGPTASTRLLLPASFGVSATAVLLLL